MDQVTDILKDCSVLEKENTDLNKKRSEYITWPDYFMAIAFLSAQRSKDPRTQVGACIVNVENKIVGIGYNGMPVGCNDDEMPWGRNPDNLLESKQLYDLVCIGIIKQLKYTIEGVSKIPVPLEQAYFPRLCLGEIGLLLGNWNLADSLNVCHAELNAVLNRNSADVKNCTIYVALFPCNECAKVVIQSGIKEVVYYSDKYRDRPEFVASKRMLDKAGVTYRQYIPKQSKITIDFTAIDAMTGTSVEEVLNGN